MAQCEKSKVINVRTTIGSSTKMFLWRPYTLALEGWRKNSHIHDAPDNNESSSVVLSKWNEENDKENLSIGVCQTVACDIVPPGSAKNQTHCEQAILFPATECQLKQVEDYPDVPPGFPPKC
ncbi:hypothetical protein FXO38_20373 [Capsicum annuum]|uniref:Uncharacterized protein n=1 Tax=Capsicum annuum TaxID=4072 RepID=A0A2G3AI63_CAPAN|nr:hypothetical protein FXO38_20373 [Capsicum annuum]PHT93922.1 hypothetical protein T459_01804 [Capsicum annuum]